MVAHLPYGQRMVWDGFWQFWTNIFNVASSPTLSLHCAATLTLLPCLVLCRRERLFYVPPATTPATYRFFRDAVPQHTTPLPYDSPPPPPPRLPHCQLPRHLLHYLPAWFTVHPRTHVHHQYTTSPFCIPPRLPAPFALRLTGLPFTRYRHTRYRLPRPHPF